MVALVGVFLMESGSFMPPPVDGMRPGFALASETVACRKFQLHNVPYG